MIHFMCLVLNILTLQGNLMRLTLCFRIDQYKSRPQNEDHLQNYVRELSKLEKQLIKTHEVVNVRGKHDRPVPILIPPDASPLMSLLASNGVRELVGVGHSPYLFASLNGSGKTSDLLVYKELEGPSVESMSTP